MVYIPEGVFPEILKQYYEHDKSCASLPDIWFGHKGGVSCFTDMVSCETCDVTFYWGTIRFVDNDGWDEYYCECCYRNVPDDRKAFSQ